MKVKAFTIYVWPNENKNAYEGATIAVTKDGVNDIFRAGWKIEPDPEATKNEPHHQRWRARLNVKNLLNNTLNAVNWYGKKVLKNGDVDPKKFDKLELKVAKEAVKVNNITKYGNDILDSKGEISSRKLRKAEKRLGQLDKEVTSLDDIKKIKNYPIKDITLEEADKLGFR
ncbi:MAG: hypothetical protein AAB875_05290 [Patescibacteria group bacterium]